LANYHSDSLVSARVLVILH